MWHLKYLKEIILSNELWEAKRVWNNINTRNKEIRSSYTTTEYIPKGIQIDRDMYKHIY
jgi:hypothetical protein